MFKQGIVAFQQLLIKKLQPLAFFPVTPLMAKGKKEGLGSSLLHLSSLSSPNFLALQVVVHNLPWTCTWQQLKDTFREWKAERADIVEDQWGRSR